MSVSSSYRFTECLDSKINTVAMTEKVLPKNLPKSLGEGKIKEVGEKLMKWKLSALWRNKIKLHDEKEISVFLQQQQLLYLALNVPTGVITFGTIPIPENVTLKEMSEEIKNYEVVDFDDGHPVFDKPYLQWQTREKNNESQFYWIKLLSFKNELIWQIFNSVNKICERVPVQMNTELNDNVCGDSTKYYFKNRVMNSEISLNERVASLAVFTVNQIEKTTSEKALWKIHLLPCSVKSLLDTRVRFSMFYPTVTLVADGRGILGNHAVLVIEELDEELNYCMHTIEFTGKEVAMHLNRESLTFEQRTEIHRTTSKRVAELIKCVQKIIENPKYIPEFSITGKKSILGQHNCCTWVMQLAKKWLKVDFGEWGQVFTHTKQYTKTEKELKKTRAKKLL